MNQVILNGNITAPNKVSFSNGSQVLNFSLATNQFYTSREGEKKTVTQWHNVRIFGKLSEAAEKILSKGDRVLIVGALKYEEYESKEGVKKTATFIDCSTFEKQNPKAEHEANAQTEE